MRKWPAYVIAGLVLFAVLVPAALPGRRDSFPLSIYPMYAWSRPEVVNVPTAVLHDPDGVRLRLSMQQIGGIDDPLVASAAIRDAVSTGTADELCREIADRVGGDQQGTVEVVFERHNLIEFVAGAKTPLDVTVYASCSP